MDKDKKPSHATVPLMRMFMSGINMASLSVTPPP